jgi:hypothetical protein
VVVNRSAVVVDRCCVGALPAERIPQTRRHAAELVSGTGHDRFDFALGLLMDNLRSTRRRRWPPNSGR